MGFLAHILQREILKLKKGQKRAKNESMNKPNKTFTQVTTVSAKITYLPQLL